MGGIVGVIATRASAVDVPVHAVVGRNTLADGAGGAIGLRGIVEATTLAELTSAGERLGTAMAGAELAPRAG